VNILNFSKKWELFPKNELSFLKKRYLLSMRGLLAAQPINDEWPLALDAGAANENIIICIRLL